MPATEGDRLSATPRRHKELLARRVRAVLAGDSRFDRDMPSAAPACASSSKASTPPPTGRPRRPQKRSRMAAGAAAVLGPAKAEQASPTGRPRWAPNVGGHQVCRLLGRTSSGRPAQTYDTRAGGAYGKDWGLSLAHRRPVHPPTTPTHNTGEVINFAQGPLFPPLHRHSEAVAARSALNGGGRWARHRPAGPVRLSAGRSPVGLSAGRSPLLTVAPPLQVRLEGG